MCLPRWRRRWRPLHRPWIWCLVLSGLALPAWIALLSEPQVHPLLPSILLFFTVLLCDLFLAQRPWHGNPDRLYLWWCARAEPPVSKRERRKRERRKSSTLNLE